jgi:HEAT repeat protein
MEIDDIEAALTEPDFQYRLKAIAALKAYSPDIAVPLLIKHLKDEEILVRSFVARGLGKQQTAESFAALLQMMKFDLNPNVRAEAANSLSLFGNVAAPHLLQTFCQDDHWLLRRSILAALMDMNCPQELYEVCVVGLAGEDLTVRGNAIDGLASLVNTKYAELALENLLIQISAEARFIRQKLARALSEFSQPQAKAALQHLRQDSDYRVVAATLEDLLPD